MKASPLLGLILFASWPTALAQVALEPGELYFRVAGRPTFIFGRNPTGTRLEHFDELLRPAAESGEKVVRIHLTVGFQSQSPAGEVDETWVRQWDRVFESAAVKGLHVLPVLGVWADWNDGSNGEPWHQWDKNRYNEALGGPAKTPAELFQDSKCQRLWLAWLESLVKRWQAHSNILGWEIFSELDLVSGSSETKALPFVERAAKVVRKADSRYRPVTASLSGIGEWPKLFASGALDFIQVHPYTDGRFHRNLDDLILSSVRARLQRYGKPVFIGECGLDPIGTRDGLANALRAHVGIRHAIWAAVVSGAMNGRMLWWEDGYDRYQRLDLRAKYAHAAKVAADFVRGVDFTGFRPVAVSCSADLKGAAIGGKDTVLGWIRDARCEPPDWSVRRVEHQEVTLELLGSTQGWAVEFYDPVSAKSIGKLPIQRGSDRTTVPLPPFEDAIALKVTASARTAPASR
ncbi:MAG: cellulase family glycosylhydrolase [Verrucomicrobia bacterium]|nr:cellulase family glycosylhydrolase [Verrucomicrobiota bacterium]